MTAAVGAIYCICDPKKDVKSHFMVECSSADTCTRGRWFHDVCVDVGEHEGDWWCCTKCRQQGKSAYCCKLQTPEKMVGCANHADCVRGELFHPSCIGLQTPVGGNWYCSDICQHGNTQIDHVQEYSRAVVWRGLLHMVETDVERENDGAMMMTMWRINMIEFWNQNHYKYLILGHRLLTAINGWAPQRIAQELIWNSTANIRGQPGTNLPLDLVNEFLNNEFKENLKSAHGQYTDKTVERRSRVVGTIGKTLEEAFSHNVVNKHISRSKSTKPSLKNDVQKFIEVYENANLFDWKTGRRHKSFASFMNVLEVRQPDSFKSRLQGYSKDLDMEADITI